MPLTDVHGNYHHLLFDFDAKAGNARKDAARFDAILDAFNLRRVATTSGPSGGRHIWLTLTTMASSTLVADLAHYASSLYPSLDISMLLNPSTGSARPPFSPHRNGGFSKPDWPTDLSPLYAPSITVEDLQNVITHLGDLGAEKPAPIKIEHLHGVILDGGHPKLPGDRRTLSPRIQALLDTDVPADADASAVAATILAACAHSRWSFHQVQQLTTRPGLEHLRTLSLGKRRVPRTAAGAERVLARKWRYAVEYVATNKIAAGEDLHFEARARELEQSIQIAQAAADRSPGRWHGRGLAHRLVLDAVCLMSLKACRADVEIDVRRLALVTGFGRSTCATALHALLLDGWLERTEESQGIHGAHYRIHTRFSTMTKGPSWTQVITPPRFPARRDLQITDLETKLSLLARDIFSAPRSLGRKAGLTAAALPHEQVMTTKEIAERTFLPVHTVRRALRRLHQHNLVSRSERGWINYSSDFMLERTAELLGVHGHIQRRQLRYSTERYVWSWWCAEVTWMRKKGKKKRRRRATEDSVPLLGAIGILPSFPRYPRRSDHRGDHITARYLAENGAYDQSLDGTSRNAQAA